MKQKSPRYSSRPFTWFLQYFALMSFSIQNFAFEILVGTESILKVWTYRAYNSEGLVFEIYVAVRTRSKFNEPVSYTLQNINTPAAVESTDSRSFHVWKDLQYT